MKAPKNSESKQPDELTLLFVGIEPSSIKTVISGKECMEILEKHSTHVIISDKRLPDMTGAEFVKKAKDIGTSNATRNNYNIFSQYQ